MPSIDPAGRIQLETLTFAAMLNGSILKIYAADNTYLVAKTIGLPSGNSNGSVSAALGNGDVQAGVSAKDASYAIIFDADGTTALIGSGTHLTVGTAATNVIIDNVTGWNAGDHINGGTLTLTVPSSVT